MKSDEKMPFMAHLEELRKRLIVSALAVGIGFVGSYFFAEQLFNILLIPLKANMHPGDKVIFTSLPEMFLSI